MSNQHLPDNWATMSPVQRAEWLADNAAAPAAPAPGAAAVGAGAVKPYVPYTPAPPRPTIDYAAQGVAQKQAVQGANPNYYPLDTLQKQPGYLVLNQINGQPTSVAVGRQAFDLDPATGNWKPGYNVSAAQLQQASAAQAAPVRGGTSLAPTGVGAGVSPPAAAPVGNQTIYTGGPNSQAISEPAGYQKGPSGFTANALPGGSAAPYDISYSPASSVGTTNPTPTTIGMDGPQIAHLGGMSVGYNPETILRGNGLKDTGDAATNAVDAAEVLRRQMGQAPTSSFAGNPGQFMGNFQGKSGQLENVVRTEGGYAFSPGKVNELSSWNSPMAGVAPILNPQGIALRGTEGQSPAQQQQMAQGAGLVPIAPTSNPGAVYSAAFNGVNENDLARAANLPSQAELAAIAQAQADKDRAAGGAGGGFVPGGGGAVGYAGGGSFVQGGGSGPQALTLPELLALLGKKPAAAPVPFNAIDIGGGPTGITGAHGYAQGGTFITDKPTVFPMANGGTAVTSEYNQPEAVSQKPLGGGNALTTVTPMSSGSGPVGYGGNGPDNMMQGSSGPAGVGSSTASTTPTDPFAAALSTDPEVALQRQFADAQHARDNVAYQFQRAGVGAPIAVTGDKDPGNLSPGQYFTPTDYTGKIQTAQEALQGLGPLGDPTALNTQLAGYNQQMAPLTAAQAIQSKITGLGPVGDPAALNQKIAGIDAQLAPLAQIQKLAQSKAGLNLGDPNMPDSQIEWLAQNWSSPYDANAVNPYLQIQHDRASAAQINAAIAQLDPDGSRLASYGTLQAARDQAAQDLANAQTKSNDLQTYQNQLKSLGLDPNTDFTGSIGALQKNIDQTNTAITNANQGMTLVQRIQALRSGQGQLSTPAAQTALQPIQQAFSQGTWTPQASDSLVDLGRTLSGTQAPETSQLMQDIAGYLKSQRQVPPGLGAAAYSDPTKLAAAAKFSI